MKAVAVRPADRVLEIVDHPEPSIAAPTQALLRVLDVGICGTDREIAAFEFGTPPDHRHHHVARRPTVGPAARTARTSVAPAPSLSTASGAHTAS